MCTDVRRCLLSTLTPRISFNSFGSLGTPNCHVPCASRQLTSKQPKDEQVNISHQSSSTTSTKLSNSTQRRVGSLKCQKYRSGDEKWGVVNHEILDVQESFRTPVGNDRSSKRLQLSRSNRGREETKTRMCFGPLLGICSHRAWLMSYAETNFSPPNEELLGFG